MTKLSLLRDLVLVERIPWPEKTKSGIFLPPKAHEVPQLAFIRYIGPKNTEKLSPGDLVLIKKFEGHRIELDNKLFHLLHLDDVLAKIEMEGDKP